MASGLTPEQIQYYKAHAYQTRQPNLYAAAVCGLVLSWAFVALRCFARRKSNLKFGKDDWICISSLVPLTGYFVSFTMNTYYGSGKHILFVKNLRSWTESWITGIVAYNIATTLNKISILYFYTRVFPIRPMVWIRRILSLWIISYSLALMLVAVFECIPLSSMWTGRPARCIDAKVPYVILSIVNVVTDFLILAIPLYFIIPLQMTVVRKIQVCGIFLTGGVVCVFSIVRTIALSTLKSDDGTWNDYEAALWSYEEPTIGVVAACLPTFGVFFNDAKIMGILHSMKHFFVALFTCTIFSRRDWKRCSKCSSIEKLGKTSQSLSSQGSSETYVETAAPRPNRCRDPNELPPEWRCSDAAP